MPLINTIQSQLDNKSFYYEEDHTNVHGVINNRKGNRFYVKEGLTGISSINISSTSAIQLSIPYSAHYSRRNYWGLRNEYQTEDKSVRGTYKLNLSLINSEINVKPCGTYDIGEVNDPNHDSNIMTVRGLEKNIITEFRNSIINNQNFINEIREFFVSVDNTINELKNNTNTENFRYEIHANIVQIIENNSGQVIGSVNIP